MLLALNSRTQPIVLIACQDQKHVVRLISSTFQRRGYIAQSLPSSREAIDYLSAVEAGKIPIPDEMILFANRSPRTAYEVLRKVRYQATTDGMKVIVIGIAREDMEWWFSRYFKADEYRQRPEGRSGIW